METIELCAVCGKAAPFKCTACKTKFYCSAVHQRKDWHNHKIQCRPFKIENSLAMGRYLVATRDIAAKSVIFVEAPLIIGPKWCLSNMQNVKSFPCVGCFKYIQIVNQRCPKCTWPVCSDNCHGLTDPQMHGLECGILCIRSNPKATENIDALFDYYRSDALFTLRCLLLQWRYPDRWNKILKFESHDEQRVGTRYYNEADERIVTYLDTNFLQPFAAVEAQMKKIVLSKRDYKLLHQICGIIEVNALDIGFENDDKFEASALYENACILEHSCMPNCYFTFDMKRQWKITMHAGRAIRKGEHLSIMYTHMLWGTQMRQEHLKINKYFSCKCERCMDPSELGANLSALKCIGGIGKMCAGKLLPKNPIDTTADWYCDQCDANISDEQVEIFLSNVEQEVDDRISNSATVKELERLIQKLSNFLHNNHYHMFTLKHTLIQCYGHQKGYTIVELSDNALSRKIGLCKELLNVIDIIDPNTMRLTLYTGIILYELHLAILEEHQRKCKNKQIENDSDVLKNVVELLERGKEAVALNADIIQGRKLIEAFENATEHLNNSFGAM